MNRILLVGLSFRAGTITICAPRTLLIGRLHPRLHVYRRIGCGEKLVLDTQFLETCLDTCVIICLRLQELTQAWIEDLFEARTFLRDCNGGAINGMTKLSGLNKCILCSEASPERAIPCRNRIRMERCL